MNSNTEKSDANEILARLGNLERQNRRIKLACAVTVVIVLIVAAIAAAWANGHHQGNPQSFATSRLSADDSSATTLPAAKEVRANRFVLVDGTGKTRAELAAVKDGPGLILYDGNEKPRAVLRTTNYGPSLLLCGGMNGISLRALDDIEAEMSSPNKVHTTGIELSAGPSGSLLKLFGKSGQSLANLSVFDEWASLNLGEWDFPPKTGGPLIRLSTSKENGASLGLHDEAGKTRINLGSTKDGPSLSLADEAGKLRAALGCASLENVKDGTVTNRPESSLLLFDKEGKVNWATP